MDTDTGIGGLAKIGYGRISYILTSEYLRNYLYALGCIMYSRQDNAFCGNDYKESVFPSANLVLLQNRCLTRRRLYAKLNAMCVHIMASVPHP